MRIAIGKEGDNYGRQYAEAQRIIAAEVPAKFDARIRAYLLLKAHGQKLCKLKYFQNYPAIPGDIIENRIIIVA